MISRFFGIRIPQYSYPDIVKPDSIVYEIGYAHKVLCSLVDFPHCLYGRNRIMYRVLYIITPSVQYILMASNKHNQIIPVPPITKAIFFINRKDKIVIDFADNEDVSLYLHSGVIRELDMVYLVDEDIWLNTYCPYYKKNEMIDISEKPIKLSINYKDSNILIDKNRLLKRWKFKNYTFLKVEHNGYVDIYLMAYTVQDTFVFSSKFVCRIDDATSENVVIHTNIEKKLFKRPVMVVDISTE